MMTKSCENGWRFKKQKKNELGVKSLTHQNPSMSNWHLTNAIKLKKHRETLNILWSVITPTAHKNKKPIFLIHWARQHCASVPVSHLFLLWGQERTSGWRWRLHRWSLLLWPLRWCSGWWSWLWWRSPAFPWTPSFWNLGEEMAARKRVKQRNRGDIDPPYQTISLSVETKGNPAVLIFFLFFMLSNNLFIQLRRHSKAVSAGRQRKWMREWILSDGRRKDLKLCHLSFCRC